MSILDAIVLVVSFIYVGIILTASQYLHRQGYSQLFTRKLVHICIGLWIIPSMFWFEHAWVAAIPPVIAVIGNSISFLTGMFGAIELKGEKPNYGTIFYPASFVIIILYFFPDYNDYWFAGMIGILIMTFGDTAASVWGTYFGRNKYRVGDETKSIEGSKAMFLVSFIVTIILFSMVSRFGGFPVTLIGNVILSLFVAGFSTAVEAASIRGWDNLLVPVGGAFFTYLLLKILLG